MKISSFTSEAGHWYTRDGEPAYQTVGANGKTRNTTTTLVYYLYQEGFVAFNAGRAGVASVVLFVMMLVFTIVQMRYSENNVHYS